LVRESALIAARLDAVGITKRHWLLCFIVGGGLLVDSIDIYLTAGIAGALVKQNVADLTEVGHIATATALGLGAGALAGGALGDWRGRRSAVLWTSVIVCIGALGAALSPDVFALTIWRFITALGLGAENVLAYGLLVEFLPPAVRGRWMAQLALIATCAAPLTLAAGYFILPADEGWRLLLLCVFALSCIVLGLRILLPESPRWLASRGRFREADAIVAAFELSAGATAAVQSPAVTPQHDAPSARLWSGPTPARLVIAALINVAIVCATFGFLSWLPAFFAQTGMDLPTAIAIPAVMMCGAPVGAAIGMLATDRIERKWGVVWSGLIAAAFGVTYALVPGALILPLGFVTVTAIYAFGAIALSGYMPELFATPIRMRAIAIAIACGRAVAVAMPSVAIVLFSNFGQAGVVTMVAAALVIQALAVALWGAQTRGRSIDVI
jgi:MFS transporter, putative metabolite:H+ symporter